MRLLFRIPNLKLSRYGDLIPKRSYKTKLYMRTAEWEPQDHIDNIIKKYAPRLVYNSVIDSKVLELIKESKKQKKKITAEDPLPFSLKYLSDDISVEEKPSPIEIPENTENKIVDFPFEKQYQLEAPPPEEGLPQDSFSTDVASKAEEEVQRRYEMHNWMLDYENFDETTEPKIPDLSVNYGTPDSSVPISETPCGGCGALLHCKDPAIPGYIPSEIFKNSHKKGASKLESVICQRCHFLKFYDLALEVQVAPEDYHHVLQVLKNKKATIVLLVDLLDFPCSVWPGIGELINRGSPVIVVGNKIDLLPQDCHKFLKNVRKVLLESVKLQGFATFNIKEVALISAKTGYGIEDLITKIHSLQGTGMDVYIIGCTNVGKSSLFNALIQSDLCKTRAVDLIQRATTSVWPGTTLNLLKFPIKRPAGFRQYLRHKRLQVMQRIAADERKFRKLQLRKTKDPKYASLIGHIDITRIPTRQQDDLFAQDAKRTLEIGLDETSPEFAYGKWCFDTPGVVQPDQIIHLLTTEELLLTLPKQLIISRSFCLKPGSSVFIGGLARLDFLKGESSARLCIFASNELPITVTTLEEADEIYEELLGTPLFKVPTGNQERLGKWPGLQMGQEFQIVGVNWSVSSKDVVLSNAGWISLGGRNSLEYSFRAWTPEKRGIHVRECLSPNAVALSGRRINYSVAYTKNRFFVG